MRLGTAMHASRGGRSAADGARRTERGGRSAAELAKLCGASVQMPKMNRDFENERENHVDIRAIHAWMDNRSLRTINAVELYFLLFVSCLHVRPCLRVDNRQ